ncbi:MAG: mandelate racemase, partial [Planctomycetes bacterium]|nr:mandelate racemase [Planctomycetota bacterium]
MTVRLRVREVEVFLRRVRTRMPFRYGKAEVTGQPYAHLRVRCEPAVAGVSAAALPPLWFDKRPGLTHEDTIRDLLRSIAIASEVYRGAADAGAYNLHRSCEPEARRRAKAEGMNDLTAGFGVALLDAALIDATCRLAGRSFHQGLKEDLFGLGSFFGAIVPEKPLPRIALRHTVGLSDPITPADISAPLNDGLPEALSDVVRDYRVRWFKIKLSGDANESLDRLRRIAEVLDRDAGDYEATLDGNEQFHDMNEVAELVRKIRGRPWLQNLWRRTAWIEQPVERSVSLEPEVSKALAEIPKAVIIDESDDSDDAVDLALKLGYKGISAKNCKGVFRTLHSFRRIGEQGAVLSSEDLMNIPVVPLHQDLCVAAALGI